VLSIEMLVAAQGIDFREGKPGKGTGAAWKVIRDCVSHMNEDRIMYQDIEKIHQLVLSGKIVQAVEHAIGTLD
jgi:histidine ammonia-lyase